MRQLQFEQLSLRPILNHSSSSSSSLCKLMLPATSMASFSLPCAKSVSAATPSFSYPYYSYRKLTGPIMAIPFIQSTSFARSRFACKMNGSDMISQLELGKPEERRKPDKHVNGIFWIILLNIGIYVADHLFQVRGIRNLYLYHNWPAWYQFVTATFCHANWTHLSSNLFFLYIFGKLVEEEEGNFALWLSYIVTGVGANLVSWLVLPRNAVSVGASGAVFGLFAISVLVKISWDWRKILEVLILGQFVIEKVMEAAQASTGLTGSILGGGYSLLNVNHIAHLSGALVGVLLVWLLSKVSSQPSDQGMEKDIQILLLKSRQHQLPPQPPSPHIHQLPHHVSTLHVFFNATIMGLEYHPNFPWDGEENKLKFGDITQMLKLPSCDTEYINLGMN